MSRFEASVAIDCLMAHSDLVQESYSDFLLPGHAATSNFENDAISNELCDVTFDNLSERSGTCNDIDFDDFPQLPNSCGSLTILLLNIRSLHANFYKLGNVLTFIP